MKISLRRLAPALLLLSLCTACGRSSPAERAQGNYVYKRGNGTARVALLPDERYQMLFDIGGKGRLLQGTYALRADTITLTNSAGAQIQGMVTDSALYLYLGGEDLVTFRKQRASLDSARQSD